MQAGTQTFESFPRLLIGCKSRRLIASPRRNLSQQEMRLISQFRRLHAPQFCYHCFCFLFGQDEVPGLERDARQQKMREHGLAGQHRLIKKPGCTRAQFLRLLVAAFMNQQKALIEIEQPQPHDILFMGEHFAGLAEQFESLLRSSLLPAGDGFVGHRLGCLITHAEFLETKKPFFGNFLRFLAEVQLQINLRKIQIAKRHVILIAGCLTGPLSGPKHPQSAAVFAAEVIQVGNVVIRLIAKPRHVVLDAQFASSLITVQRLAKVVQADQAHGHVVQRYRGIFPFLVLGQRLIGALVVRQGLFESILPMKNVADIVFQTGCALAFAQTGEDLARTLSGGKRPIVFAQQDQRLNGMAKGARRFQPTLA